MFDEWDRALIESCRVARLGTIAADGRPNLVPVCYAFLEDRFAISIDEKPKSGRPLARLANVRRDPRVSLLIDRYDDDWAQLAWLRIDGRGRIFERGDGWPEALRELRRRYPQYDAMSLDESPLIEIAAERHVSWRWATG